MRTIRVASAALLGAAACTALTTPVATAAPQGKDTTSFGFSVTPRTAAPGGRVTLAVTGCTTSATASSAVFDTVRIPRNGRATATVDRDATRGATYKVTFTCGNESGTARLTIAGSGSGTTSSPVPGAVQGGLGGSVGGVSTTELAAGTALVVAALTGAAYVTRRRVEGRAH